MRIARSAAVLTTAVALAACAEGGNLEDQLSLYQRDRNSAKLITIEAAYALEQSGPTLRVHRAAVVSGKAPFLLDADTLTGRLELLDSRGRVLWSLGYVPGPLPPLARGDPSLGRTATRLRLRTPYLPDARRVRLIERRRGLAAEADIVPAQP